jgi:hypothetical protein
MGGYTPFSPGFQFPDPLEEERKRKEEEARKQAMGGLEEPFPIPDERRLSQLEAVHTGVGRRQEEVDLARGNYGTEAGASDYGSQPQLEKAGKSTPGSITDSVDKGADYIDKYAEALGRRPDPEDYEPSTLRKILSVIGGTLAGGNPELTRQLAGYGKYDRDVASWQSDLSGLGTVEEMRRKASEQDVKMYGHETTRRGQDVTARGQDITAGTAAVGHGLEAGNLEARLNELEQRKAEAQSEEEQNAIQNEIDQAKVEIEGRKAATGERRAGAYEANVESLSDYRKARTEAGWGSDADVETLSPSQQTALETQALDDVVSMNPDWEKFARFHETTGDVLGRRGDVEGEGPGPDFFYSDKPASDDPDYQEFMMALEAARRRRGATAGLEDVPGLPVMGGE